MDLNHFREAGKWLKLFGEQLPAAAWATDRDLRILWSMGAAFQAESRALVGKTISELTESFGGPEAAAAHLRALDGATCKYEGGEGTLVLEARIQPLRDAEGRIVGTIGVALDISERKIAEDQLRKTQQYLLEAQRAGQVRVWQEDLQTGLVTTDVRGSTESLAFEEALELIHPEDRAQVLEARRQALEGKKPLVDEHRVVLPGGVERVVLSRGEVVRDASGRPLRVVGTAVDITERKREEEALRKTQQLLLDAEALGKTGSWEMDLRTGVVLATDENRRLFFGDDASKGNEVEDYRQVFHPDDRHFLDREMERIEQGCEPGDLEYRIVRPDRSVRVILSRTRMIRDENGRPLRTYGTNRDITERKHAEEELARCARHHAALAQIGLCALRGGEMQALLDEAVAQVAAALGAFGAMVLEALPGDRLLLRAGKGPWKSGAIGSATVVADASPFPQVLRATAPMASDDLAPALVSLVDCGAAAGAAAAIQGPERPFGVLGVLAPRGRNWSHDDLNFLQTGANMLATTIERERVAAELRAKREQLQSLSRLLIEAQEVERRAVARELHDDLGQVLTAIKLNVQRKESSEEETITLVDGAIARVRELAQHLRPPMLDLLGLEASLRSYVKREAHRAGLEFHFALGTLERRAPPTVETACFRIVQEALTNVIRHAQARRVDLELVTTHGALQLVVRDDGKGFEVTAAHKRSLRGETQGLLSMQERVSLVGGELEIDSAPGRGTAIRVCFPLAGGIAGGGASRGLHRVTRI